MTKIDFVRVFVSIFNLMIIAPFTFLFTVLLYHNLDSSMLKNRSSLTELINLSLKSMVYRNSCIKDKTLPILFFNHLTLHVINQNLYLHMLSQFQKFHLSLLVQNRVVNNPKTLMVDRQLLRGGIVAELSLNDCVIKYRI